MLFDSEQLDATAERFAQRQRHRERNQRLIGQKMWLKVDSPERVRKFLERRGFDDADVTVMLKREGRGAGSELEALANVEEPFALERMLGTNDLMGVAFLEAGLRVSQTVARIWVRVSNGRPAGYGTGFMVSPRLLMTNHHVLRNIGDAQTSLAEFGFQLDLRGLPRPVAKLAFDPGRFFFGDPELDYAVVVLADGGPGERALDEFGFNPLIAEQGKAIVAQWLNIIQHPNGEPKQIALRENQMIDLLPDFVHYRTDTAPGSSGSPVYNDAWEVVALHHSGVPQRNRAGEVLAIDGQVWRKEMGEHRVKWIANEGVRISRIVADLKGKSMTAAQRALLDEAFQSENRAGREVRRGAGAAPIPAAVPPQAAPGNAGAVGADGSATWTIPLSVTVRLGGALAPVADVAAPGPARAAAPAPPEQPRPGMKPAPEGDEQAILRSALRQWAPREDVLNVRLGYVFENGWITDKRALVATVRQKLPLAELRSRRVSPLPETFQGMPVEIVGPTVEELLTEKIGPTATEALLPSDAPTIDEITYEPPNVPLAKLEAKTMRVVAHCSPDVGWPKLSEFLQATEKRLVVGMYDFGAEHIVEAVEALRHRPSFENLILVMQSSESLGGGTKAHDLADAETVERLRAALGAKFRNAWVKMGPVNGWVAYSYHIKVAVRDRAAIWLSSGNWQSSNQPNANPRAESPPDATWLTDYNREWHCVVEHPDLAKTFEEHVLNDFENNKDLDPDEASLLPGLELAELLVPESLVRPKWLESITDFQYFDAFDDHRPFTVEPLLTPDNYHEGVLEMIASAEDEILWQNQTLNVPKPSHKKLQEVLDALLAKQNQGVKVRCIFRLFRKADAIQTLIGLKELGFDTDNIRVQPNCHTKGIIVDRKRVLIGSHNWSNAGVSVNRDASLLFDDAPLAEYFARVFEHDWRNLATQDLGSDWEPVEWADTAVPTPPRMVRLSVQDLLEMV